MEREEEEKGGYFPVSQSARLSCLSDSNTTWIHVDFILTALSVVTIFEPLVMNSKGLYYLL